MDSDSTAPKAVQSRNAFLWDFLADPRTGTASTSCLANLLMAQQDVPHTHSVGAASLLSLCGGGFRLADGIAVCSHASSVFLVVESSKIILLI